jgi:uncharacterized membrane protein (UPF0127 family)
MKKVCLLIGIIILVTALVFLHYIFPGKKTPQVVINNHTFNLEIAKTEKEQEIGLAKYKNIPQNFGMLFPFEKPNYHSFWMKNMKFPIDIIFIRDNKIIKIFNNVPAPKSNNEQLSIYTPDQFSDTVLEINAGLSDKYNFQKNESIVITY